MDNTMALAVSSPATRVAEMQAELEFEQRLWAEELADILREDTATAAFEHECDNWDYSDTE